MERETSVPWETRSSKAMAFQMTSLSLRMVQSLEVEVSSLRMGQKVKTVVPVVREATAAMADKEEEEESILVRTEKEREV